MTDIFDIRANHIKFPNPIALSAMAGITNADFALKHAHNAGLVILGSYNLDDVSKEAAYEAAARGRREFIFEHPLKSIEKEIKKYKKEGNGTLAVSVRSAALEKLMEAAELFKQNDVILEIDAHCRQPEFTERNLGQGLFKTPDALRRMIIKIKETGVVLSVKFRSTAVSPECTAEFLEALNVDIIHIDAMINGGGSDFKAVRAVRNATDKIIIANNSVTEFSVAKEFFTNGADIVSLARGAASDERLIPSLVEEISQRQIDTGWYNSPAHICRGGDNRGLAFCCPPVKHCYLLHKLKEVKIEPEEFANIKMELSKETPLLLGESTCFGSLTWCCKTSKPCYIRDGVFQQFNLPKTEYMKYKKEIAKNITKEIRKRKKNQFRK